MASSSGRGAINGTGIPDFLEGDMAQNVISAYSTRVDVNGKTIHSLEDLPPEVRQSVGSAFQILSNLGMIPGVPAQMQDQNQQVHREPMLTSKPFVSREYNPMLEEDQGAGPVVWIGLGAALILCCVGAVTVAAFLFASG